MDLIGSAPAVPIVGQPSIVDWGIQLTIKCPHGCEGILTILGQPGSARQCGGCGRIYIITGLPVREKNGEIRFALRVQSPTPVAPEPPK